MRALVLALPLLGAAPHIAHADGWAAEGCREDSGGDSGGCSCDSDNDPMAECSCTTSDPVSIGTTLGIVGLVAWRIGRERNGKRS